jgi:hypothetical protein
MRWLEEAQGGGVDSGPFSFVDQAPMQPVLLSSRSRTLTYLALVHARAQKEKGKMCG